MRARVVAVGSGVDGIAASGIAREVRLTEVRWLFAKVSTVSPLRDNNIMAMLQAPASRGRCGPVASSCSYSWYVSFLGDNNCARLISFAC